MWVDTSNRHELWKGILKGTQKDIWKNYDKKFYLWVNFFLLTEIDMIHLNFLKKGI